ncbi:MAG: cytochrome C, partial [gamma proteobacterium symbiont of Ctena orbiculata]
MAQAFTKEMSRNIFYGGTAFFFLLFLALTFDTHL